MVKLIHHMGVTSLSRSAGLLVLVSILLFQFMASSAFALPSSGHGHSQTVDYRLSDCEMKMENAVEETGEHSGHPENAAHCVPSLCCFHDTFLSAKLVSIGLLLPSSLLIAHGTTLSSYVGTEADRPPKHA